jgi:hypothetical protein
LKFEVVRRGENIGISASFSYSDGEKAISVTSQKFGMIKHRLKIWCCLDLIRKLHPENPKWRDLQDSMVGKIEEERRKRGAGEKPKLRKYDGGYVREEVINID